MQTFTTAQLSAAFTSELWQLDAGDPVGILYRLADRLGLELNPDRIAAKRRMRWAHNKAEYARRRAKLTGCTQHISGIEIVALIEHYGNRCNRCGGWFSRYRTMTLDHIVPLSQGGNNTARNIQLLCWPCHMHKEN